MNARRATRKAARAADPKAFAERRTAVRAERRRARYPAGNSRVVPQRGGLIAFGRPDALKGLVVEDYEVEDPRDPEKKIVRHRAVPPERAQPVEPAKAAKKGVAKAGLDVVAKR